MKTVNNRLQKNGRIIATALIPGKVVAKADKPKSAGAGFLTWDLEVEVRGQRCVVNARDSVSSVSAGVQVLAAADQTLRKVNCVLNESQMTVAKLVADMKQKDDIMVLLAVESIEDDKCACCSHA